MIAKCSIVPDVEFKVHFVKGDGIEVRSLSEAEEPAVGEPLARELIRGALLLTGLGLTELWNSFGGANLIDTVIIKDEWFTILPKDTILFASAKLKIENWLIQEAKLRAEDQDIVAKIDYKSDLPVTINVESNSSKFTIKHSYGKKGSLRVPTRTEIIGESPDIPEQWKHVVITYSIL